MGDYKGYDYTVRYDADYIEGLNWMFSIYKQYPNEYKCLHIDYLPTRAEAVEKARAYIDSLVEGEEESNGMA